jgi:hypothetical protein
MKVMIKMTEQDKKYYERMDADESIPMLEEGQLYQGVLTGKVYEVYKHSTGRIALRSKGKKSECIFDTHLDMFEWDKMIEVCDYAAE